MAECCWLVRYNWICWKQMYESTSNVSFAMCGKIKGFKEALLDSTFRIWVAVRQASLKLAAQDGS